MASSVYATVRAFMQLPVVSGSLLLRHAYIMEYGLQVACPAFENHRVNGITGNLGIEFRMCRDQYGLLAFCEDRYLGWQVGNQLGRLFCEVRISSALPAKTIRYLSVL